jgi:hypothetical protein
VGCVLPLIGSNFYPFWSLSPFTFDRDNSQSDICAWDFGNVSPRTTEDLGKDAQYGTPDVLRYGGTSTSAPRPNPEFSGRCGHMNRSAQALLTQYGVLNANESSE